MSEWRVSEAGAKNLLNQVERCSSIKEGLGRLSGRMQVCHSARIKAWDRSRTARALDFILLSFQLRGDTCGDGGDLSQGGHLLAEKHGCSSPRLPAASSVRY